MHGYTWAQSLEMPEGDNKSPKNLSYRWLWGTWPEYWKPNLGNLQEQQALVAAEPSLQHHHPQIP